MPTTTHHRINLDHAVASVAGSLHSTILRTSAPDDLFVQFAAVAVIRAAEPHMVYRYTGTDANMRIRLGLTVGDWTITTAAVDAVATVLRRRVAGMDAPDTQIQHAAVSALRAALTATA